MPCVLCQGLSDFFFCLGVFLSIKLFLSISGLGLVRFSLAALVAIGEGGFASRLARSPGSANPEEQCLQ